MRTCYFGNSVYLVLVSLLLAASLLYDLVSYIGVLGVYHGWGGETEGLIAGHSQVGIQHCP